MLDILSGMASLPHASADEAFQPRWRGPMAARLAIAWCIVCLGLTADPLVEHVRYFGDRLGTSFQWAITATLIGLAFWSALYARLRVNAFWRHEPRALTALALIALLWTSSWAVFAAAVLALAFYSVGAEVLERLGLDVDEPAARLGLATAAGAGLLVLAMIPVGLAGGYSGLAMWLLSAGACFVGRHRLLELPGLVRGLEQRWRQTPELRSPLVGVAVAILPAFLIAFILAATAPAIAYDAISHHLPAARHYLEGGRLEPLPIPPGAFDKYWLYTLGHAVAYSYYPQSFEELLTLAWGLGGQPAAQLVSPLVCFLSLSLLVGVGRLAGVSRLGCVVGALAGFALPFASWIGAIAKNDYLLALFQLASLYCLLRARRGESPRWLVTAAAFLGLSFGVKHTALFLGWPLGLLLLWELRRRKQPWRPALAMALAFTAAGLFWHARTYALTGNPLYPATADRGSRAALAIDGTMPSRWTIHLTYPWFVHFDGTKTMEGPSRSPAGFFFLFFAPLWLFYRRRQSAKGESAILLALLGFYLYWAYIWGVLRYGLAPALLLAALTGDRIAAWGRSGAWAQRTATAAVAYCFAFALLPALMVEVNWPQLQWAAGRISREEYLTEALRDYASIAFVNGRQQPHETTLAVNNCSSVYAADPARFRCVRYRTDTDAATLDRISEVVESSNPDYLVIPADHLGEEVFARLPAEVWGKALYEGRSFRVFGRSRK